MAACASSSTGGGNPATTTSSASSAASSSAGPSAGDTAATAASSGSGDALDVVKGKTFVSTDVSGRDLVEGSTIRITFPTAQTISVNAGCNTMSGVASVDAGVLRVGQMAATQMACADDLMAQDTWLSGLLTTGMAIDVRGDTLVLSADGITITMTDTKVAEPDLPFVGTEWTLDGIVANDAVTHYAVTATMSTDGTRITYQACNTHSGDITINGNTATTEKMLGTTMACPDDREQVERAMDSVLNGTFTFEVDGNELTVTGADGTKLTFTGKAPDEATSGASTLGTSMSGTEPASTAPAVSPATTRPADTKSLTVPPRSSTGRHDSFEPPPSLHTAIRTY